MTARTALLSTDAPRSDGQRDLSKDESGGTTVLLVAVANVAFFGLVCSVLVAAPLSATPALFLACSAALFLCVGPPLLLYLLCFLRLLAPDSILTVRAGHGAVVATPGLLLLASTLPLLLLLVAVAIAGAGARAATVLPLLLLLLLLPLGTSLHAARRLSVLHSKGMREQGFSGHGHARNLGDLVRKLAVVPAPLLAVAPAPLRRLLEERSGRENDHIGKGILVTHSSTVPHTATNDAADGVSAAATAARLARMLTLSASAQVALQLYAGVAARAAAATGGVLPVAAWLLLLCAAVGAALRCAAHAGTFGALAAAGALPPRAVHRWWALGLADLPTVLCAQVVGGVAVPLVLTLGTEEAAGGDGGGGGGSWSAGWQLAAGALLLCYCALAASLSALSRRHVLCAARLSGNNEAYAAMLQGAGAALTAAAAAKPPPPSLSEAAPNGAFSSAEAASATVSSSAAATAAAAAAGRGSVAATSAAASSVASGDVVETPQSKLDEHALGDTSPVVGGGLNLRHFTGGGGARGEATDAVEWFVLSNGGADADATTAAAADAREGPYTLDALVGMIADGACGVGAEAAQCRVWHRGLAAWTAAGQIGELQDACGTALAAAEPREQRVSLAAPAPPMLGGLSSSTVGKPPPKPLAKKKSALLAGPPSMPGGVPRRLSRADPSSQQASAREEED